MTVNVSPSVLADVIACGTKAWVRHVQGYTGKSEGIKLTAGSAIHAAMAAYLEGHGRAAALNALQTMYEPAFAALPAETLPEPAYLPANLLALTERWIEMHPPHALPWVKVLSVEEAFESRTMLFPDGIVSLIVRPDAIVEDQFGRIRWFDTKTTGWRIDDAGWQTSLRLSLQAALYTDAMVQRYGERANLGGWYNAMEIARLPSDPTRKCKVHGGRPYAECGIEHAKSQFIECLLSPERIEQAVQDARWASEKFLKLLASSTGNVLDMNGTARGECRFCPASSWCEAERVTAALPSFMKHDPWIVETGKR